MRARVCMVVNNLDVGGLEKVVLSLLDCLDRVRFEPYLVCLDGPGKLFDDAAIDDANRLVLTKRPVRMGPIAVDASSLWQLRRFLAERHIDIVHAHNLAPLLYGGLASRTRLGGPIVLYSEHNQVYSASPASRAKFRYYARIAHHIVAVSHDLERTLREQLRVRLPITVIHNGIDGDRFQAGEGDAVRQELGVGHDEVLVGTGVVLSKQKGIEHLIEAASQVLAREPAARFVVAGDGALRASLEQRAAALGDRFVFLGYRRDMPRIISALDVYVLPSLWEGLPLALLEAMAIGKPIVCTRVGGNPEVVEDGVNGSVVAPGDAGALAEALCALIRDAEWRRQIGERNRADFEKRFSESAMTRVHEDLYERLLMERHRW